MTEVTDRAKHFVGSDVRSSTILFPVSVKLCGDCSHSIAQFSACSWLHILSGVTFIDELSGSNLRKFLKQEAMESRKVVILESLDDIVSKGLQTIIADSKAKSSIKNLFFLYQRLLRRYRLYWILDKNVKVAVFHVLLGLRSNIHVLVYNLTSTFCITIFEKT